MKQILLSLPVRMRCICGFALDKTAYVVPDTGGTGPNFKFLSRIQSVSTTDTDSRISYQTRPQQAREGRLSVTAFITVPPHICLEVGWMVTDRPPGPR